MVMSLARCISAISAGDLIIRQPAVTAVASTNRLAGAAARSPSAMKKRTRSSMPIVPVATPRSLRMPDTTAPQSSSSCHTRTSSLNRVISRARASSKAGATYARSPFAGITSRNGRSLVPQDTSTKYRRLVPGSRMMAPRPCSLMSRRAFSMRACRSSSPIGTGVPGNGSRAAIAVGGITGRLAGRPGPRTSSQAAPPPRRRMPG